MTLYEEAYEKFLAVALAEWAEAHKDDAIKAFRDFFGKSEEAIESGVSYYGWQGPVSYQIRWKGEAMAKAEVFTGAALFLLRELDAERKLDGSWVPAALQVPPRARRTRWRFGRRAHRRRPHRLR